MIFLVIGVVAMIVLSTLFFITGRKRAAKVDFDNSALPMWIFDRETLRFLAVNNAATALYGYTQQEFLQRTIKDIRVDWEADKLQAHINEKHLSGKNSGVWKHRKKNGEVILVRVSAEDTQFKGKPQRLITVEDITHNLTAQQKG
jgi:PAS domain S-box-containing protein